MAEPFVIDSQEHRLVVLAELLCHYNSGPVDVATAHLVNRVYRLVRERPARML